MDWLYNGDCGESLWTTEIVKPSLMECEVEHIRKRMARKKMVEGHNRFLFLQMIVKLNEDKAISFVERLDVHGACKL